MDDGFEEEDEVIYDKTSLLQRRPPRRTSQPNGGNSRKGHICRLASVVLVFVCLGISLAIPGPTLRCFEYLTHSEEHLVSCLFVGRAGGILIASLATQLLLDFMPADCLSVTGLLVLAVAHFVIPWSERIWWLVGAFALQGAAIGLVLSGGLALTRLLYGARHLSLRHFFLLAMAFGCLLTPFLVMPFQADELTTPASRPVTTNLTSAHINRFPRQVTEDRSHSMKRDGVGNAPIESKMELRGIPKKGELHRGGALFPLTPTSTFVPVKSMSSPTDRSGSSTTTAPSMASIQSNSSYGQSHPPAIATATTSVMNKSRMKNVSKPSISIFSESVPSDVVNASEAHESQHQKLVQNDSINTFLDEDNLSSSSDIKPRPTSPSPVSMKLPAIASTMSSSSTSSIPTTAMNSSSSSSSTPTTAMNNSSSSSSTPTTTMNNSSSSSSIPTTTMSNSSSIPHPMPADSSKRNIPSSSPASPAATTYSSPTSSPTSSSPTSSSPTSSSPTSSSPTSSSFTTSTTITSSTSTLRGVVPGRRKPSLKDRYHHLVGQISSLRPVQRIYLSLGALCLFVCLVSLHLCCACRRVPRFPVTAEPTAVFGQRRFAGSDLVFIAAILLLSSTLAGLEVTLGNYLYAWARRETPGWTVLASLLLTAAFWLGLMLGRLSLLLTGRCSSRLSILLLLHLALLLAAGAVVSWLGSRRTALNVGVALAGWGLGPARSLLALWLEAGGMKGAELRWMTTLSSVAAGAGEAVLPLIAAFAHQLRTMSFVCGVSSLALFVTAVGLMRWRIGGRARQQEEDEELLAAAAVDSDDPEDGTFALRKLREDGGKTNGDARRQRLVDMEEDELDLH